MTKVIKGQLSVKVAAAQLGRSERAIFRWKKDGLTEVPPLGAPTLFPPQHERALVTFLHTTSDNAMGYSKTQFRKWIKELAAKLTENGVAFAASEAWVDGFLSRNPDVLNRVAGNILKERIDSWNVDAVLSFYGKIAPIVAQYDAAHIFNQDETGLELKPTKTMVRVFLQLLQVPTPLFAFCIEAIDRVYMPACVLMSIFELYCLILG